MGQPQQTNAAIAAFTDRAQSISQGIRDLAADLIAHGEKHSYLPGDLSCLLNAASTIEGRTKLLNEALQEISLVRLSGQAKQALIKGLALSGGESLNG